MICNNIAGFNLEYHLHLKALVNFITENSFDAHVLLTFLTTTAENGGFSTKNNLAEVAALFSCDVLNYFIILRDAFQKKVHMEGNSPNLSLPPPPFKIREQNRKNFFLAQDPPPLKTREISYAFFVFLETMNFGQNSSTLLKISLVYKTINIFSLLFLKGNWK